MDKPQLPKMLKKLHLLVFLVCSLIGLSGYAQTFPVTISTQITQPSPIYLSNYADATTINSPIKIQLVLNDLTISNRQVRLKFYFQGNSVSFSTNDFVVGARPLYLEGGFPLQLTNVDLAPYFEFQNILGLNPNQYAQPLPEGIYNFSVEVYDFATNKKLSKKTNVTTIIFQNEPPFLNLPLNNASIMQSNIQNIIFSWTPRSINVSNVEYEFSLVEIWDNYTPVQNAFAYSPPLYTTTTRNTTFQYGMSQPQLIPGKKYAWRIKAKAILGAEEIGVFKNNGYSEIFSFNYEVSCTAPLSITTTGISEDQAKVSWSGNLDNFDYQVNYREKNANSEWYKVVTPRESITISNLKPNATYEYTVGASCDVGKYTHSTIHEFTTLAKDEIAFAGCGIKPDPKDLANKTPLPQLFPNDVVTAGDFPIVVLKATGSNGNFTGEGYVTLPFLEKFRKLIDAADALGGDKINLGQFSRIRITFNNIGVNTDFKLISGEIVASYDPDWGGMADLDSVVNDAFGDAGNVVNHQYNLSIDTVVKNPDGTITVTSTTGVVSVIEKTVNDIVITDKDGKQFAVPANAEAGKIEKTGQLAPGGIPTSKNTNGMGSGGDVAEISSADVNVLFSKGDGKYSFDTAPTAENGSLTKTYQTIPKKGGGTYKVNYKAISDNPNTDVVVATVDFKNGKTKKDLVFKTQNGTAIDSTKIVWKDNVATLTLKKTLDFAKETIIVTVKPATPKDPKEAAGKYDIAGTMDLWHLTNKKVNVTLVRVNKATIPSDAQSQLNAIYEPAGVTFNVNTIDVTLNNTWGESIATSESGLLATYTPEQQQITANLKQTLGADYKKDTYYVIYTDTPSDKSNILGFMPLKRQYGFIFNKANVVRTLAHELGHGVFGLQHPFTEYNTSTTTDLLMDYGTGVALSHNDWQVLHAPGLQLYPFIQGDSDGEFKLPQLTPNWEPFTYEGSNTYIAFDRNNPMPNGAVHGISVDNISYIWDSSKNNYFKSGSTVPLKIKIIDKPNPDLIVQLFWMRNQCGYDERYTSKWSYISDKKGFNIDDIKENGQVTFSDRIPCKIDSIDQGDTSSTIKCDGKDIAILNKQKEAIVALIDTSDIEIITTKINEADLCSIRKLTYEQLESLFLKLSGLKDIKERHENAILKIMSCIKEDKYMAFINLLLKDNNTLIKHLISQIHNHSIYKWDENNLTSFTEILGSIVLKTNSETKIIFLNKLKENNYSLFRFIWEELGSEPQAVFVFNIASIYNQTGLNPGIEYAKDELKNWSNASIMAPQVLQGQPVNDNFFMIYNPSFTSYALARLTSDYNFETSDDLTIKLQLSPLLNYEPENYNFTCKPFDWIVIQAQEDVPDFKLKKGDLITVPAIFVVFLQEHGDRKMAAKYFTIITSIGAIVAPPALIGNSIFAITINTSLQIANIGITVYDEEIAKKYGEESLETWKTAYGIYNLLYTYDVFQSLRSGFNFTVTKINNINKISNLKIHLKDALENFKLLNYTDKVNFLTKYDSFLVAFQKCKNLPEFNKTLKILLEFRLKCNLNMITTSKEITISIEESGSFVVNKNGIISDVGEFNIINGAPSIIGNWLPSSVNNVSTVAEITEIRYIKNNTSDIGTIQIVEDLNKKGTFYVTPKLTTIENSLAKYPNIRKNLGNSLSNKYLNNSEYTGNNAIKKQLNTTYFQNTITKAHPEVLKYMDEMDEYNFSEMVRGYRDLVNNEKFTTFENAIKTADDFYGKYNGWFTYWKLTPDMKTSMETIVNLRNKGKLLPTGNANDLQLSYVQVFTRKGDFVNIPMRYEKQHFLGEYGQKGFDNITQCLDEFRKIPERQFKGEVFSGKTFSEDEFNSKFIGGAGKIIEYTSFVSSSLKKEVAEGFIELTAKHAGTGKKIAVIQRIITKNGVYVDDLSDWGINLGNSRHSDSPLVIQVQYEVLMNPGSFRQIGEPIPIKDAKGVKIEIGGYEAYYLDLIEL